MQGQSGQSDVKILNTDEVHELIYSAAEKLYDAQAATSEDQRDLELCWKALAQVLSVRSIRKT